MPRIKVIHATGTWLPLTQSWMHTQARHLPADQVDLHVVCSEKANQEQFSLPQIHCLADQNGGWIPFRERLVRKLLGRRLPGYWYRKAREIRPQIWHSHFAQGAWVDREVAEWCGAKHVLSVYGADISQNQSVPPWNSRVPEILRQVDCVLCEGPHMVKKVVRRGCPAERARVHHLGIDTSRIQFRPRQWRPGHPLRVLLVGTFREKKGIPYALKALGQIRRETPLAITLIGDATTKPGDAEEKREISRAIEEQNLQREVKLLGFQPYARVLEEAYQHDIFLSPSITARDGDDEGGAPVTLIEMAASGMPVISTRHCDIPEVIRDGETGLLADERDVIGLVGHVKRLLSNPGNWLALVTAARARVEREYDAAAQGRRLADIYRELIHD